MAEQNRKLIGVCGSRIFEQIPMSFVNELRDSCVKRGYCVVTFSSNVYPDQSEDDLQGEIQLFDLLKYLDLHCLVVMAQTIGTPFVLNRIVVIAHQRKIPVFVVDGHMDGCYNLTMDYNEGFAYVVQHVIKEHNCRKINMIAGYAGQEFSEARIAIYKRVLAENGIPFEEERLAYGGFWDRPTREVMEEYMDSGKELPDAIVCANDSMAVTVCSVLNKRGYKVPDDVIVTGFDGTLNARYHVPELTTCAPDYFNAAEWILERAERAKNTGKTEPEDMVIHFALVASESCGCESHAYHDINSIFSSLMEDLGDCSWHNIAMNEMVASLLDKNDIMDIAVKLPEFIHMWNKNFRFACVGADLMKFLNRRGMSSDMISILWNYREKTHEPGEEFDIADFVPHWDEVISLKGIDVLVVRLLNSGKRVYGYTVEGFERLDDRRLQRSNEFAMFLSFSIDAVLHNHNMNELNENLREANRRISDLSILDPMTEIYNRRGFYVRVGETISADENEGKYLYLFSLDLDKLKYINDTYGHGEGDYAITTCAHAIKNLCGDSAICSRFGGDEFVCLILDEKEDSYRPQEMSEQLNVWLQRYKTVAKKPYPLTASVGMVCEKLTERTDVEALLKKADALMYQNKMLRKKQRTE